MTPVGLVQDRRERVHARLPLKRPPPGNELVKDRAEGELVGAEVDRQPGRLQLLPGRGGGQGGAGGVVERAQCDVVFSTMALRKAIPRSRAVDGRHRSWLITPMGDGKV